MIPKVKISPVWDCRSTPLIEWLSITRDLDLPLIGSYGIPRRIIELCAK